MSPRQSIVKRTTSETSVELQIDLDGTGTHKVDCQVKFLGHMLEQLSRHGFFDIQVCASGDIEIDDHHLVEDVGIALGEAFAEALGDKSGINRYGFCILPMDEAITTVALDLSGRFSYKFDASFKHHKVGDMSTDMVRHFWDSFAQSARINLYIKSEFGENDHHVSEGIFKACARALRIATELDPRRGSQLPTTKGKL